MHVVICAFSIRNPQSKDLRKKGDSLSGELW